MKQHIILAATCFVACTFTACMDSVDEPPVVADAGITSPFSVGEVNTTIKGLKDRFQTTITSNNSFELVTENIVFEGVVVGNDVSGNLYQTLLVREILDDGTDQCIQVGIKNTHLCPYFPLGQTVRINLNGLYIGNYSYVPKVGTPYKTSSGNIRLGPMLLEDCRTHIQLVGFPSSEKLAQLLTPIEVDGSWLASDSNRNMYNTPVLATMVGTFTEANGERIFTPNVAAEEDPAEGYDAGYARNRDYMVGGTKVLVRTSTRNEISYTVIPSGQVRVTGMLTYYGSDWQLQMRDLGDLQPLTE